MKKFTMSACYALGFVAMALGLMMGIFKPSFNTAQVYTIAVLFYALGIAVSVAHEGEKTRRLMRKIHGIKKEEGEED